MGSRKNYKQIAYEYIRGEIISNRLSFGEPVVEQSVADALHISRTPIREAIKQLESDGLVVCYPFQGTFVTSLAYEDVVEICSLRALLEVFALERSIYLFTDDELDELCMQFQATRNDARAYQEVDARFHSMIVTKANYKRTASIIASLNVQIERFRNASQREFDSRGNASLKEHLELIELIRMRDLDTCRRKLREHLMLVSDFFVAHIK